MSTSFAVGVAFDLFSPFSLAFFPFRGLAFPLPFIDGSDARSRHLIGFETAYVCHFTYPRTIAYCIFVRNALGHDSDVQRPISSAFNPYARCTDQRLGLDYSCEIYSFRRNRGAFAKDTTMHLPRLRRIAGNKVNTGSSGSAPCSPYL